MPHIAVFAESVKMYHGRRTSAETGKEQRISAEKRGQAFALDIRSLTITACTGSEKPKVDLQPRRTRLNGLQQKPRF